MARICDACKEKMLEGFVINSGEDYYCCDECLLTKYTHEEYMGLYDEGEGDSYWTDWYGEDDDDDDDHDAPASDVNTPWDFVVEHYPNYYSDEKIALNNDLIKILNQENEDGDSASILFTEKYKENYNLVKEDHDGLLVIIYETAIKNFILNENK